jgi:hypothetical protein
MYIIYNQDGSVRETNFTEFINKGNNNVNKIYVEVLGRSYDSYGALAMFKLPNGEIAGPIEGELVEDYEDVIYYDNNNEPVTKVFEGFGYLISLSQDVTAFAGIVKATIKVYNEEDDEILFTYPVNLTINDSAISPEDLTQANLSQYNNLKAYLDGQLAAKENKLYKHLIMSRQVPPNFYIRFVNKNPNPCTSWGAVFTAFTKNPLMCFENGTYVSFMSISEGTKILKIRINDNGEIVGSATDVTNVEITDVVEEL